MSSCVLMLLLAAGMHGPADPGKRRLQTAAAARVGADGLSNGWRLGRPPQVPAAWTLNSAYPGELAVCRSARPSRPIAGSIHTAITAAERDRAHLSDVSGLESGEWYRVSAWVRGGAVACSFYEYFQSGNEWPGGGPVEAAGQDWRQIEGFYRPPAGDYIRSALALISVPPGQRADIDDVAI